MLDFRLKLSPMQQEQLKRRITIAEELGDLAQVKRLLAILSLGEGYSVKTTAEVLKVSTESVRRWLEKYLIRGFWGLKAKKSPGRPNKLTKRQKQELSEIIVAGPAKAGFSGNCWRSPMIQHLIYKKWQVFYAVNYLAQLLKNMGFSYQKARFISDHLDKEKRQEWLNTTWPNTLALAKKKDAYLLFGDEASFAQWGSLSYTWSLRGQQPLVPTSGTRKAYKIFGLIDYFTGKLFSQGIEGRFNSDSYQGFLTQVLASTNKHIVLIQDGARYHTSKQMLDFFAQHQLRLTVVKLPAYSPDFNPIENLWKNLKQNYTHLHYFPTFDSLIDKVDFALLQFADTPQAILGLFGFYDSVPSVPISVLAA